MPEPEAVVKPKTAGFVDSKHNNANKRRIEEEQAELDKLTAAPEEEASTEEPVEEKVEVKKEENLSPEEKTYKKRHTDARKYINEQDAKIKALEERLNNPDLAADIRPPKSDEDIGAWAEKYPDVAAIVETIAEKKAQEKFSQAEDRLQRIDEINAEAQRTKAENEIRKSHSDFDELKDSDAFHDWADVQPKWVKDALYKNSDDAMSVVRVIDLYKVDNGIDTKGKKASTKEAASVVVPKRNSANPDQDSSKPKYTESMVDKMSMEEYEKHQDAILQASRDNPNFYDITGAAR
jgi:hypothetical protein